MPIIAAEGSLSSQGYGQFAKTGVATYIEDVFSTYLYTGNGSTQTITNGIDLSTKGGLVWFKSRSGTYGTQSHVLTSNELTNWTKYLSSNTTGGTAGLGATAFTPSATGFALNSAFAGINDSGTTYASWTFRKQPKFFDVVTYTGNGTTQNISHSLGSVPGCIIVKRTNLAANWFVWHRGLPAGYWLLLNDIQAQSNASSANVFGNNTTYVDPTSTVFTVGSGAAVNASGGTYVAYLFAHNAGGFGLTGTDNVISCGSFTSTTAGTTVTLGYEPQYLMMKPSSSTGDWIIVDNMRGFNVTTDQSLYANTSDAEVSYDWANPTATGFIEKNNNNGVTYIYIAIRRGPMKVPTSGTSVFTPTAVTSSSSNTTVTAGFPVDLSILKIRNAVDSPAWFDRLRGITASSNPRLLSNTSGAESSTTDLGNAGQTTVQIGPLGTFNCINYNFQRAPGFFDEVCFTATGSTFSVTHNLGVAPELVITKEINGANAWYTYSATYGYQYYLSLNGINAKAGPTAFFGTGNPTSTTLSLSGGTSFFSSGQNYVAYLFASCPGVSKVGSYTGTGALQTINCGFTSGARFVLIKRTDSTGDWYVYDSARGITSGNDPYYVFNTSAAEVTGTNYVDTDTTGFKVTAAAPAGLNANGGTFIFLAVS